MAGPRQRTGERREQIARAALEIIGSRGVHRLTAVELGRMVGISDGTIFRHFKDKAEIVLAAIEQLRGLLFEGEPPGGLDPLRRLETFFVRRLTLVRKHPTIFRLAMSDRLEEAAGTRGAAQVRAMMDQSRHFVRAALVEAQARREIDPALSPQLLEWIVLGTLKSAAFAELDDPAAKASEQEIWRTLELLLRRSVVTQPRQD